MSEAFYTVDQAADRLKLHPKTVLRFIKDDRLRATRIGKSYRIVRSDLDAFAGVSAGARAVDRTARVTAIIDLEIMDVERSQRIATFLNAAIMSAEARPDPVHLTTAFDAAASAMKVVIVGTPADTAHLLQLVHLQLENSK